MLDGGMADEPQPIERAVAIYERRVGRKVGAIATLAGVAGAGALGALRFGQFIPIDYVVVAGSLAAGMAVGPIADRVARSFARRRVRAAIDDEAEHGDEEAPLDLRARLRAQTLASSEERASQTWPITKNAVLAIVGFLWPVALIGGFDLEMVGKALAFLAIHGSVPVAAFSYAAYRRARRMLEGKPNKTTSLETLVLLASLLWPAATTDLGMAAAPIAMFALGLAGLFVMLPATTWMHRRSLRERNELTRIMLPSRTSDPNDVVRILRSTLDWDGCPGALRARALRELAAYVGAEGIAPDVERAIGSDVPELRLAGLKLAHKLHLRPPLGALLTAEKNADADQAALLPALFHRHAAEVVEPALLRLLEHEAPEVAKAAAESLGLVGSLDVIPILKTASLRGRLAAVCHEAIERIRIRLAVGPGRLSLAAADEAGALSDATQTASLSLPD